MTHLHIDFETRSACELKDAGLHNYAAHPTTDAHCMAYAFGDEAPLLWRPGSCDIERVKDHIARGGIVYAHNAAFELAIWNHVMVPRYGWPVLKAEQVRCTMAMCYAMALPGALENAAPALGLSQRKDAEGKRIMLQLAKPKPDGTFWTPADAPEKFERLYAYCRQDVEVERAMTERLLPLSDEEQALWVLDQTINNRGVQVDLPSIEAAMRLVDVEKARLNREMLRTTGGVVGSCTEVQLLIKWIRSRGVAMPGVAKADVLDALKGDGLPADVRAALKLRQEAAKSSTAKLLAMKNRASADGRVRGIHQFHGASTGRWAGRGVQTQNMPRPRKDTTAEHIEDIFANINRHTYIDAMYGPVMDALADCVRGCIIPAKGNDLCAVDFSAIEARVLAWLAGEEKVLEIFRTHGKIYEHAAAGIYHVPMEQVTKDQRQIGKVAVLALGYGGGVGAFQSMAKVYGVKVEDAEADEIKAAWRRVHPKIVAYWYDLEEAAIGALTEGDTWLAGEPGRRIAFKKAGSFLWCRLPSGRCLCYPYPELRTVTTPWGAEKEALTFMTELDSTARKKLAGKLLPDDNASGSWQRTSTYGGSLAENVTQAVARDLLAHGMFMLERAGYPIVMHVHDESVVEIASSCDDGTLEKVESLMAQTPPWARGLPVTAEGWRGPRYRK